MQRPRPSLAPSPRLARRAASALALVGLLCTALPAGAYTVDRKFGVGFEQTLTGLPSTASGTSPDIAASGLLVQYWYRHVGFEAILGGRGLAVPGQPLGWAGFLGLGVHYNVFRAPQVNLSAGLRVNLGLSRPVITSGGEAKAGDVRVGAAIEVPLRAMFFLSDHFAFTGAVGPVIVLGSETNPLTGEINTTSVSLFRGGFSGGLGFVVFFN